MSPSLGPATCWRSASRCASIPAGVIGTVGCRPAASSTTTCGPSWTATTRPSATGPPTPTWPTSSPETGRSGDAVQHGVDAVGHLVDGAGAIDLEQDVPSPVEVHQRG